MLKMGEIGEDLGQKLGKGAIASVPQGKDSVAKILEEFINKRKILGVYLTTTQPHERIVDLLRERNIDHTSLFFLDLMSKNASEKENLFVLRDPSDLTELSVVITEIMENEGIEFLVIDGVGGFENYVEGGMVKKFLHALVSYFKKLNKTLVILYTGMESKDLMNFIVQISDYHKERAQQQQAPAAPHNYSDLIK